MTVSFGIPVLELNDERSPVPKLIPVFDSRKMILSLPQLDAMAMLTLRPRAGRH